jgi:stage II sporulation protein R
MNRKWKALRKYLTRERLIFLAAFAMFLVFTLQQYRQEALAESISSKVLRFHVLANSDSEEDQELKLEVRDAVGAFLEQELSGIAGLEESREVIQKKLNEIEMIAESVVKEYGSEYLVKTSLVRVDFPPKSYGALTFPAGNYEALQVCIGTGEGQNWWCVMYPNLCFRNGAYQSNESQGTSTLQNVLTPKEYQYLMEGGAYEIRFRWLSFLNP